MNSTQLVFLAYINRSGSTFLAELMSAHSNICVCPEAEVLIRILLRNEEKEVFEKETTIKQILDACLNDEKFSSWGLDSQTIVSKLTTTASKFEMFEAILQTYRNLVKPEAGIIVFKGTELLKVYSKANLGIKPICIVVTRDGRAAFASQKKSRGSLSGMPMQVSPVVAAKHWADYTNSVMADKSILHIKYEDLIENNAETLDRVWKFLNLDLSTSIVQEGDLTSRIPENQKHLHKNIGKGPIKSRIDSWMKELSPAEITLFESEAGETLAALDYQLLKPNKQGFSILIARVYFGIRHFMNQLLNRVIIRFKN